MAEETYILEEDALGWYIMVGKQRVDMTLDPITNMFTVTNGVMPELPAKDAAIKRLSAAIDHNTDIAPAFAQQVAEMLVEYYGPNDGHFPHK